MSIKIKFGGSLKLNEALSILELLLVMAILTVLFGIVIFAIRPEDIYQDSDRLKIESDRKEIQTAYTQYKLNSDGQSPFGDNLINGINYKICKKGITDCNTDNYEVSLDNLLNTRLIKDIPEAPGNEDVRYTGYELAELDGIALNLVPQSEIVYTPENTPPGECFDNDSKTYCVVEGGGGELWLDRNLGGDNAGGSETDAGAYGELYQFGRGKDGHEIRTSGVSAGPSSSTSPGSNYLSISGSPYNWYNGGSGDSLWQGESGINNPCPNTWRLPSEEEWSDEISSWSSQNAAGGYGSSLKLVKGGRRDSNGSVQEAGSTGYYWSYSVENGTDKAKRVRLDNGSVVWDVGDERVEGMTVRCIRDKNAGVGAGLLPAEQVANFNLANNEFGECSGSVMVNGSYRQGMGLTGTETVELSVFVASVGSYTISTDIINGYSFSKTGTFNSTGNTTVVLVNDGGIPEDPGTDRFTISANGTTCSVVINVSEGTFYCPENYVRVPGNSVYGVSNYCLMKYEAKIDSNDDLVGDTSQNTGKNTWPYNTHPAGSGGRTVVTTAQGYPIANITKTQAQTLCTNLGTGFHLPTNEEWMTLARNIEVVDSNWTGATVANGVMFSGHNDDNPNLALEASTNDAQGYDGTGNVSPSAQRRTYALSNGETIWDISGNISELIDQNISCTNPVCSNAEMPYDFTPTSEWFEYTAIASYGIFTYNTLRPAENSWSSLKGIGKIFSDNDASFPSGNIHSMIRGGSYDSTATNAGIYSLDLGYSPDYIATNLGLRCASGALTTPICLSINKPGIPSGPNNVYHATSGHVYTVSAITNADYYEWDYTGTGETITSGASTTSITVSYASGATSGSWRVRAINEDYPVLECDPAYTTSYGSGLSVIVSAPPTTVVAGNSAVTYSPASQNVTLSATLTSSAGTVNAGTVTFQLKTSGGTNVGTGVTSGTVSAGSASVTYSVPAGQTAGTYNIHATYNPAGVFGAGNDTDATLEFTINKASQAAVTISATPNPVVYPNTVTLTAGGGSGTGSYSYAVVSGPGTLAGNIVTPTNSGTIVVNATRAADTNYNAATSSNLNITVTAPACASISTPAAPTGPSSVSGNSGNQVYSVGVVTGADYYEWSYSGTGATVISGQGTTSITVNYSVSATSGSWTVRAQNNNSPLATCSPVYWTGYGAGLAVTINGYTFVMGDSNDQTGRAIAKDTSGNIYIFGNFQGTVDFNPTSGTDSKSSAGGNDVYLTKLNSNGTYGWTYTFGNSSTQYAGGIALDTTNNIYITGSFEGTMDFNPTSGTDNKTSAGAADIFITKITSTPGYGWTYIAGGTGQDEGKDVALDASNNIFYTGNLASTGTIDMNPFAAADNKSINSNAVFLTKLTATPAYGWTDIIADNSSFGTANGVTTDTSGNIYIVGEINTNSTALDFDPTAGTDSKMSSGMSDIFLTKINAANTYGWTYMFSGTNNEEGKSVARDASNNIYITGEFAGTVDFNPTASSDNKTSSGNNDIFLTKINAAGTYGWTYTMGGTSFEDGLEVTTDGSSNIYVTGSFSSATVDFNPTAGTDNKNNSGAGGYPDVFVTKINAAGTYGWTYVWGAGSYYDFGSAVIVNGTITYVTGGWSGTVDFDHTAGVDIKSVSGMNNYDIFYKVIY